MSRPAKKISVETVAWVAEYLVSRVNRADWKLKLSRFTGDDKRNSGNGKPKSIVYRIAAQAVDLQDFPGFGQDQLWLDSLSCLIEDVNTWIDEHLDSKERTRLWTAHRVAQTRGIDPSDLMIFENYQMLMQDKQQELNV